MLNHCSHYRVCRYEPIPLHFYVVSPAEGARLINALEVVDMSRPCSERINHRFEIWSDDEWAWVEWYDPSLNQKIDYFADSFLNMGYWIEKENIK